MKTTEGFQNLKQQKAALEDELPKARQALIPLTKENERVVLENNELHREIIEIKERL